MNPIPSAPMEQHPTDMDNPFLQNNNYAPVNPLPEHLYPNIGKLEIDPMPANPWEGYQIILAVDISASMKKSIDGTEDGISRLQFVKERIQEFCEKALTYDKDGLDLFTFSTNVSEQKKIKKLSDVDKIFKAIKANGKTNTHDVIEECYNLHLEYKNDPKMKDTFKGSVIFVITDGKPTRKTEDGDVNDSSRVESKLVEISKKVSSEYELGISFLQVGNDSKATSFLTGLDNNLIDPETNQKVVIDIVDHKSFHDLHDNNHPLTIEEALYAALHD